MDAQIERVIAEVHHKYLRSISQRAALRELAQRVLEVAAERVNNLKYTESASGLASDGPGAHKWEPDFSRGECLGCKTCGVCGTTHQSRTKDAELIDRQYLQNCVLKADLDHFRMKYDMMNAGWKKANDDLARRDKEIAELKRRISEHRCYQPGN